MFTKVLPIKVIVVAGFISMMAGCVVPKSFNQTANEAKLYYQTTSSSAALDCLADESRRNLTSRGNAKQLKIAYEFTNPIEGTHAFLASDLSPLLGASLSRLTANPNFILYHDAKRADIVFKGVVTGLEEDGDTRLEGEAGSVSMARRKKTLLPSAYFEVRTKTAIAFPSISFTSAIDENSQGVSIFLLKGNNLARYDARSTKKSVSLTRTLNTMADAAAGEMFAGVLRSWGITTSCLPKSENIALHDYSEPEVDVILKLISELPRDKVCFLVKPREASTISTDSSIEIIVTEWQASSFVKSRNTLSLTLSQAMRQSPFCIPSPITMDSVTIDIYEQNSRIGGASYYKQRPLLKTKANEFSDPKTKKVQI